MNPQQSDMMPSEQEIAEAVKIVCDAAYQTGVHTPFEVRRSLDLLSRCPRLVAVKANEHVFVGRWDIGDEVWHQDPSKRSGTFIKAHITSVNFNHGHQPTYGTNMKYAGVWDREAIYATKEEALAAHALRNKGAKQP